MSASDCRGRLDRGHPELSIRRQCEMLGRARSGVYRKRRPANDNDLVAMRRIDALFTARPFFGAGRIAATLIEEGFPIDQATFCRVPLIAFQQSELQQLRAVGIGEEHNVLVYQYAVVLGTGAGSCALRRSRSEFLGTCPIYQCIKHAVAPSVRLRVHHGPLALSSNEREIFPQLKNGFLNRMPRECRKHRNGNEASNH